MYFVISVFQKSPVTPIMMDYIANMMDERDFDCIVKRELPANTAQDDRGVYDKSFTALKILIEKEIVKNCLQMVKLLEAINMEIAINFEKTFTSPQQS